jgi:glycosyltransferase involved in cell wall biosynthesis
MADYLTSRIGITPDRIQVIHNAVDFSVFNPQCVSKQSARQRLGISDDDIVLGFVGRLNPIKGPDLLVEATALLSERSPRYLLLLAGDGAQRKSLEKSAEQLGIGERVRFLGFCDNIPEVMAAFDIGIVPSRQESFGIVCLELMRMKIPVISSGAGGMAEYITDHKTGLLLRENTPQEICRCANKLAEDEQLRNHLIDAAYKLCDKFGVEQYAESYRKIYQNVLGQSD